MKTEHTSPQKHRQPTAKGHASVRSGASDHSRTTTDHRLIRQWVEERGGHPARVRGTGAGHDGGLLRIDFPNVGREHELEAISWEEFFEKFEEKRLAFLYQERQASGEESRFSKLVSRDAH